MNKETLKYQREIQKLKNRTSKSEIKSIFTSIFVEIIVPAILLTTIVVGILLVPILLEVHKKFLKKPITIDQAAEIAQKVWICVVLIYCVIALLVYLSRSFSKGKNYHLDDNCLYNTTCLGECDLNWTHDWYNNQKRINISNSPEDDIPAPPPIRW